MQPMTINLFRPFFLLATLFVISLSLSFSQQKFDVISLKSGGKVIGTILKKKENQPVILQLQSGDKLTIQWNDIKAFDVLIVQEKDIDEKVKEEYPNDADFPWRLIYISGGEFRANRLDSLSDICLYAMSNDKYIRVRIDSIAALVHFKEGHFWIGAGVGFLVGTVTGIIIGALSTPKQDPSKPSIPNLAPAVASVGGGLIGAVLGFFTGGIAGGTDGYEIYDLRTQTDFKMKRQILHQAFDN